MSRSDLERLSKDELSEVVLKLQRLAKTSRTSSKSPSTDRKKRREQSRPGGAKPGHEGYNRVSAEDSHTVVDHRPTECPDCGLALSEANVGIRQDRESRSRTRLYKREPLATSKIGSVRIDLRNGASGGLLAAAR